MPAAAFAVRGRARAVASWLNLVERLVVGADDQGVRRGTHGSVQQLEGRSATGRAVRGPCWAAPTVTRRNAGGLRHVLPSDDIAPSQPAAEVSPLVSEGPVGVLR